MLLSDIYLRVSGYDEAEKNGVFYLILNGKVAGKKWGVSEKCY